MATKDPLQRNIKVDVYNRDITPPVRTSTTLNYALCNYLFYETKPLGSIKFKTEAAHRKWLVNEVQKWVNTNSGSSVSSSNSLEYLLARELYNEGFRQAKNIYTSDNLQLDL